MEQLFHVGIKALVRNERGEILLVGSRGPGSGTPHLDLPGGRMEPNETLFQTLDRELLEEIGLSYSGEPTMFASTLARIQILDPQGPRALLLIVYTVTLKEGSVTLGDEEEVSEWLSPTEAAEKLCFKYDEVFCAQVAALGEVG